VAAGRCDDEGRGRHKARLTEEITTCNKGMTMPMMFRNGIAALMLILTAPLVSATTLFVPTDGDVNTFAVSFNFLGGSSQDLQFGLFDDAVAVDGAAEPALLLDPFDQVLFTSTGDEWLIESRSGATANIGASQAIQFGFLGALGWEGDIGYDQIFGTDAYRIFFASLPDLSLFVAVDVTPVLTPIPPAIVLFGSVLVVGAFLGRQRKAKPADAVAV
jgi:hypothetical protein